MNHVVQYLRKVALRAAGDNSTDAELLEAFLTRRDQAAFEMLLRRHGAMVLGVCRRALRNAHDAEGGFPRERCRGVWPGHAKRWRAGYLGTARRSQPAL